MLRSILWLATLGAALYIGCQYGAPQFRAWRFRDAVGQTARLSNVATEDEIRRSLQEAAEEFSIPLRQQRLRVKRDRRGLTITADWEEVVRIDAWKLGQWVDTLRFTYDRVVPSRRDER